MTEEIAVCLFFIYSRMLATSNVLGDIKTSHMNKKAAYTTMN